jgi:putative DNA methylase
MHGQVRAWTGAQGLAEDLRYYGEWIRGRAEAQLAPLYPKAVLPNGSLVTVIAWFVGAYSPFPRSSGKRGNGSSGIVVHAFDQGRKEGLG